MKLSELLADNPHLDTDLDIEGELVMDALYLFRTIHPEGTPGSGRLVQHGAPGTDGIVARGMLSAAQEINAAEWPVHVCPGHHDEEG